jgi:hypothetical protein
MTMSPLSPFQSHTQDDVVLSVNIKSAEAYTCDGSWQRAFADVAAPDFLLHKVCRISDLTVCLDQKSPTGKIDVYQEPLLYRCSIDFRLRFAFPSQTALLPSSTTFHLLCRQFDFSLSDVQAPLLVRLVTFISNLAAKFDPGPDARPPDTPEETLPKRMRSRLLVPTNPGALEQAEDKKKEPPEHGRLAYRKGQTDR